ncbi:MAG: HAD hydrolase-like protein [Pseudolabrys sp.]|nr:HAD hydrolase-like protein [Pseudolabrys sp.]
MIRVVIFDFDGTLADTNGVKEACLHRTVAELNGGAAALAAARQEGGDRSQIFAKVAQQLSANSDAQAVAAQARALVDAYSRCCASGIAAAPERSGAVRTLAALARRRLHLWVLSATPDRHLVGLLRRRGLVCWLKGSLGSSVTKEDGLRRIMAIERADRNSVLLVGDGPDDQRAARAVGVKFAAVVAENRIAARGRFAVRDLRPLVPLIDSLNSGRRLSA